MRVSPADGFRLPVREANLANKDVVVAVPRSLHSMQGQRVPTV